MRGISLKLALLVTMTLAMATLSGLTQAQPGWSLGGDSSSCDSRGFWSRFIAADPSCDSGDGEDDSSDKDEQSGKGRYTYASYGDNSEKSDKSGKSGRSGGWSNDRSDKSDKSERSEKSDKSGRSGGWGNDRSDKSDKSERSEKSGKSERSEKSDKSERSEKSGKSDKSGKGGNGDAGLTPTDPSQEPTGEYCTILNAGQNMPAGSVCVTVTETEVLVDYIIEDGWDVTESHLWLSPDPETLPVTGGGNPVPGQFPFSDPEDTSTGDQESYRYTIPTSQIPGDPEAFCGNELYVAAHAATSNGESAWAGETRITDKGNWAYYFSFPNDCSGSDDDDSDAPQVPEGCHVAYAQGSTSFAQLGLEDTGYRSLASYTQDFQALYDLADQSTGESLGSFAILNDGPDLLLGLTPATDPSADPAAPYIVEEFATYVGPQGSFSDIAQITDTSFQTASTGETETAISNPGGTLDVVARVLLCSPGNGAN